MNALTVAAEPELGQLLGADRLDGTIVDLETWRHSQGEVQLESGDVVCLPEGPAGAHELLNRSESPVRALLLSTTGFPANVSIRTPRWLIRNGPGQDEVVVRESRE